LRLEKETSKPSEQYPSKHGEAEAGPR